MIPLKITLVCPCGVFKMHKMGLRQIRGGETLWSVDVTISCVRADRQACLASCSRASNLRERALLLGFETLETRAACVNTSSGVELSLVNQPLRSCGLNKPERTSSGLFDEANTSSASPEESLSSGDIKRQGSSRTTAFGGRMTIPCSPKKRAPKHTALGPAKGMLNQELIGGRCSRPALAAFPAL